MTKVKAPSMLFEYAIPGRIELTMPLVRATLREVQAQLLAHKINGGGKKLVMSTTTRPEHDRGTGHTCGMAACIGGWASLFLLGFDKTRNIDLEHPADELFNALTKLDRVHGNGLLNSLFHDYHSTYDYDEPNIAATAIKRYLAGKQPWPSGKMPGIMPYTTKRAPR